MTARITTVGQHVRAYLETVDVPAWVRREVMYDFARQMAMTKIWDRPIDAYSPALRELLELHIDTVSEHKEVLRNSAARERRLVRAIAATTHELSELKAGNKTAADL